MSTIPALPLPTTHPVATSSSVVPPRYHPSHVSPPPIPGNTFPITTSSARSNLFRDAVSTYADMMALAGIPPDQFAFPVLLKAAAGLRDLNLKRQIHAQAVKLGYEQSSITVANTTDHA
ncbi:hypothetical protein NL676_000135 [Syzygium grande]|nr:hypothetical protein NL676_000135 [Syzygium grande]